MPTTTAKTTESEFVFTRVVDAPRERVWKAWTEVEHLGRWWGPKGFAWVSATLDLRPGGVFHYCLRSPDGRDMWGKFVYREIVPPEKLVFVVSFTDDKGNAVRHPMSPTWPLHVLNTLTFSEQDRRTTLLMRAVPIDATESERKTFASGFEAMRGGFGATLNQLAAYLAGATTGDAS